VLVVDPCEDNRDSLALLLKLWGHDVRLAHDGPSALEVYRAFRPQLVLLEICLGGMDGWEVGQRLRQEQDHPPVLVAYTGYGREQDRARSREAGFAAHITKPGDVADLERLLVATGLLRDGAHPLPSPHLRAHRG